MIVRKPANGELLLIGQTDHSRLAGQLAAHWGNENFAAPDPYESVVRGATFHDYGWLRYETSPLLNPSNNEPYKFLELPLGSAQLSSYQWALDWLFEIDPYAGLVVNMHRTGLWQSRYNTIARPQSYVPRKITPEIDEFIKRNEIWQERERQAFPQESLWINYRLLQVWDILALYLCCDEPYDECIEPVPASYSDKSGLCLTLKPANPGRVLLQPYPFDVHPLSVQFFCRRLPKTTFQTEDEFRRCFFGSKCEVGSVELI